MAEEKEVAQLREQIHKLAGALMKLTPDALFPDVRDQAMTTISKVYEATALKMDEGARLSWSVKDIRRVAGEEGIDTSHMGLSPIEHATRANIVYMLRALKGVPVASTEGYEIDGDD